MSVPVDVSGLTRLFQELGARDPEGWARSQVEEGIPQLARFLFLRQAWRQIVPEGDTRWIDVEIARAAQRPAEPFAGVGRALARLRALGATDADLIDLVRGMQARFLFQLCYLLEDPGDLGAANGEVAWALKQVDDDGNVVGPIDGLHESVWETDPAWR